MDVTADLDENCQRPLGNLKGESQCAYLDRSFELEEDGLRDEDLARLGAEVADLSLKKLNLLSGTAAANLEETVNDGVEIDVVLVRHVWR